MEESVGKGAPAKKRKGQIIQGLETSGRIQDFILNSISLLIRESIIGKINYF